MGLVEPEPIPEKVVIPTLDAFLDGYIERHGNSPRIAQQSYLLVTEDDFAKAAGVVKVMME